MTVESETEFLETWGDENEVDGMVDAGLMEAVLAGMTGVVAWLRSDGIRMPDTTEVLDLLTSAEDHADAHVDSYDLRAEVHEAAGRLRGQLSAVPAAIAA